jgi:hypothetical protein
MASKLQLFDQYHMDGTRRLVAIDPRKVSVVRETAHGSVYVGYTQKVGFEVRGEIGTIVGLINEGRSEK